MCCKCLISGFLFTTFFPLLFIIISTSSKLKLCFLSIVCLARAVLTLFPYVTCEAIYFVDIIFGFLWIDFVLYPAKTNFYFISESPGNIAYIFTDCSCSVSNQWSIIEGDTPRHLKNVWYCDDYYLCCFFD